ncbi:MAG TPA: hypothetical protein VG498_25780 [Terriglobales bacterium]|nr:hypothetical protein [Terriglobales bacterium]
MIKRLDDALQSANQPYLMNRVGNCCVLHIQLHAPTASTLLLAGQAIAYRAFILTLARFPHNGRANEVLLQAASDSQQPP